MSEQAIARPRVPEEERILLAPLLRWLQLTRRVREDTLVVPEVVWLGRRIDLVTCTRSGILSAYELKLAHITRALEQATYNRAVFDRSYLVTASFPKPTALQFARSHGVGVILVRDGECAQLLRSPHSRADARLRRKLLQALGSAGKNRV
jgi:hypothetical protein